LLKISVIGMQVRLLTISTLLEISVQCNMGKNVHYICFVKYISSVLCG